MVRFAHIPFQFFQHTLLLDLGLTTKGFPKKLLDSKSAYRRLTIRLLKHTGPTCFICAKQEIQGSHIPQQNWTYGTSEEYSAVRQHWGSKTRISRSAAFRTCCSIVTFYIRAIHKSCQPFSKGPSNQLFFEDKKGCIVWAQCCQRWAKIIDLGPICITDLFQNNSVACFNPD